MTQTKGTRSIGLDMGTSRIVIARPDGDAISYSAQLNAFVDLPYSRLTESSLNKENVPHAVEESRIVVLGSESARFADLLGVETRRSMSRGILNPSEPESLVQLRRLLEHELGKPETAVDKICFSVPSPGPGTTEHVTFHEASLRQMIGELGYECRSIAEGLAVVYAELERTNYTGVGVSFGGGLCNVCLAYLSVPVACFSIGKAGDYIDSCAAAASDELVNRIRLRKEESFYFNGYFTDKALQALSVYYEDMIAAVVDGMREQFTRISPSRFKSAVPIVLAGGSAMPKGFRDRFEQQIRSNGLPLPVSEVRLASDPLHTTAKGALLAVMTE